MDVPWLVLYHHFKAVGHRSSSTGRSEKGLSTSDWFFLFHLGSVEQAVRSFHIQWWYSSLYFWFCSFTDIASINTVFVHTRKDRRGNLMITVITHLRIQILSSDGYMHASIAGPFAFILCIVEWLYRKKTKEKMCMPWAYIECQRVRRRVLWRLAIPSNLVAFVGEEETRIWKLIVIRCQIYLTHLCCLPRACAFLVFCLTAFDFGIGERQTKPIVWATKQKEIERDKDALETCATPKNNRQTPDNRQRFVIRGINTTASLFWFDLY